MPANLCKVIIFALVLMTVLQVRTYADANGVLFGAVTATDIKSAPGEDSATVKSLNPGESVFVTGDAGNGWYSVYYKFQTCYVKADAVAYLEMEGNPDPATVLGKEYQKTAPAVEERAEEEEKAEGEDGTEDLSEEGSSDKDASATEEKSQATPEPTETPVKEDTSKEEGAKETSGNAVSAELEEASREFDQQMAELELIRKEKKKALIWEIVIAVLITLLLGAGIVTAVRAKKKPSDVSNMEIMDMDAEDTGDKKDETDHSDPLL